MLDNHAPICLTISFGLILPMSLVFNHSGSLISMLIFQAFYPFIYINENGPQSIIPTIPLFPGHILAVDFQAMWLSQLFIVSVSKFTYILVKISNLSPKMMSIVKKCIIVKDLERAVEKQVIICVSKLLKVKR